MNHSEFDTGVAVDPVSVVDSGVWVWVLRGLAAVGLGICAYLAWAGLTANPVIGCGGGDVIDCSHVLSSKWSKIGNLPVGVPAFGIYCVLISALVFCRHQSIAQIRQISWTCVTTCGVAAGLAAVWFTGLQIVALEHICPWCLAAHTCSLLICGILLWKHPLGIRVTGQLAAIATLGVALMMAAQVVIPAQESYEVLRFDEEPVGAIKDHAIAQDGERFVGDSSDDVFAAPGGFFAAPVDDIFEAPAAATSAKSVTDAEQNEESSSGDSTTTTAATLLLLLPHRAWLMSNLLPDSTSSSDGTDDQETSTERTDEKATSESTETTVPEETIPERRLIGVNGNKFRLDIRQWPLLGPPEAKYVFVEMFDYTCLHCRNTNRAIRGAFDRYGDDLAVIALPVPLDRKCNSSATSSGGTHRDSCEISRIAVAVWRIDAKKFHQLHNWLFERARTARSAKRQAEVLVGKDALTKELNYPTAGQYIAKHVQLYKRVGAGSVPKLMFPKSSMVGEVSSTHRLCSTIERELAATDQGVSSPFSNDDRTH